MATWQAQEAETMLGEVIELARTRGPQMISHQRIERAVLLSLEGYRALAAHKPDFNAHLLGRPNFADFPIKGSRDSGRPFEH
jgi:hypothetical protein